MNLFLCDTPDCQVVTFTESDAGGTRCPGCGFIGDWLRETEGDVTGARRLARLLLERRPKVAA